ncbi:MAG: 2-C-methyl-D-erythritol 4-phosphate cytidylyltransferase [Armatimonadota bacterium]
MRQRRFSADPGALIPAAGRGERVRERGSPELPHSAEASTFSKVLLPILGRPMLCYTIAAFEACAQIGSIVVTTAERDVDAVRHIVAEEGFTKVIHVIAGGATRQESVRIGLEMVPSNAPLVAIHDGARPAITQEVILRTLQAASEHGAAVAAIRATDTVKLADQDDFVTATPSRDCTWCVQTPQTFRTDLIREAHRRALEDGFLGTDDASLVERLGHPVKLVEGSRDNIKVTYPEDLQAVEAVIRRQRGGDRFDPGFRVGIGYDIHRLVEGRSLVLGGVAIPSPVGLSGHSDADAALHAAMDALLGAAGLPDIGCHFPDTDPTYAGASSLHLLAKVVDLLAQHGWRPANVDVTIVAEQPKLAPHVPAMKRAMSGALGIPMAQVGVKATTNERLGPIGAGEAIAAYAVATIARDVATP